LLPLLDRSWHRESKGEFTETFARKLPNADLPGMVGWIPPGTNIATTNRPRPLKEEYQLTHRPRKNDHIVFSRLWWPGYEAEFAGKKVSVHAEEGVFVTVDLPNDAPQDGILKLRYRPPYWIVSLSFFMAGLLLCVEMTVFRSRLISRVTRRLPLWAGT
jgi:hypothetical protein